MNITEASRPIAVTSTAADLVCDLCGKVDEQDNVIDKGPLHSMLIACIECRHLHCSDHHFRCHMCWACCAEHHGLGEKHDPYYVQPPRLKDGGE